MTTTAKAKPKPKPTPTAAQQKVTDTTLAANYGMSWALINSDHTPGGLYDLFRQATAHKWTAAKFTAMFQSSPWYQKHSDNWRQAETLFRADPKSYAQNVASVSTALNALAIQQGITIDPKKLGAIADVLYRSGSTTQPQMLATLQQPAWKQYATVGENTGQTGTAIAALRQTAYDYGYTPAGGDAYYQNAAYQIAMNQATPDTYKNQMITDAASKYAAFKDQILGGQTVRNIASSYITSMANTLELDPASVDLQNPAIQKALTGYADKTGAPVAQSLWDFTKQLKDDPRWQYTQSAKADMASAGMSVLKSFGFQS